MNDRPHDRDPHDRNRHDRDPREARAALRGADEALRQGIRAGARPAWYPVALGFSVALALASFAVPWLTMTGVVLGGILLPLVFEGLARRRAGASPAKTYFAPGARAATAVFVIGGGAVCAAALVLLKTTGEVSFVLAGAVLLGMLTTACTWKAAQFRQSARSVHAAG